MIPVRGYAVARGDMIDVRTVAKAEIDAMARWLEHRGFEAAHFALESTTKRLFSRESARENAVIVRVEVSQVRTAAQAARADEQQPEAEEGDWE